MGNRERRKGAAAELEVAAIFREWFPTAGIERAKRGRQAGLDIVRVPGSLVSVKRHEVLRLPAWIREADGLGNHLNALPIVAYRTNATGAVPHWRGDIPLRDLARLLAAREALERLLRLYLECVRSDEPAALLSDDVPEVEAARAAL